MAVRGFCSHQAVLALNTPFPVLISFIRTLMILIVCRMLFLWQDQGRMLNRDSHHYFFPLLVQLMTCK